MSADESAHMNSNQLKHQTSAQTARVTSDLLPQFLLSQLTERWRNGSEERSTDEP